MERVGATLSILFSLNREENHGPGPMGSPRNIEGALSAARRCYRDDGLIRADFQGESAQPAPRPTKKSTLISTASEDARLDQIGKREKRKEKRRQSHVLRRAVRCGPGFRTNRARVPLRTRVLPRLASPRRAALIPSYLGTHHATGCLFSFFFFFFPPSLCSLCPFLCLCVSLFLSFLPRRRGGAESFNISRRPPREASSSVPLLSFFHPHPLAHKLPSTMGFPPDLLSSRVYPSNRESTLSIAS